MDCLAKLESVSEFEIVVVDDGSSDDTYVSLNKFKDNKYVQILHIERDVNSCRSKARNLGWKNARGDFIVFIDSDILVRPNHLKELDRYFNNNKDALVLGCRTHIRSCVHKTDIANGKIFSDNQFKKDDYSSLDYRYLVFSAESFNCNAVLDPWLHAYSCNFAIRKEWLIKTNGFDENIRNWGLEDVELAYRFYKLGVKIAINPYLEVLHQNALPCHDDINIREDRLVGYKNNIDYFLRKHPGALLDYADPHHLLIYGKEYNPCFDEKEIIDFYESDNVQEKKQQLLSTLKKSNVVFRDHSDISDFDCWIQNLPATVNKAFYFPMSRKIDVCKMKSFIEKERNR